MSNNTHIGKVYIIGFSLWPFIISGSVLSITISLVSWFHGYEYSLYMILVSMLGVIFFSGFWFRDLVREATHLGYHTKLIQRTLYAGMVLFILSEIMFFVSFFWTYFYNMSNPSVEIGQCWPPKGIPKVNYLGIPLLNTAVLISSGVSLTWSQRCLRQGKKGLLGLFITIVYGIYFLGLQGYEYYQNYFTIADSVYGSIFYLLTGFHGFHVFCGTVFLIVCYIRMLKRHYTPFHHVGYVCAIWYWHFVDVVWIFVYFFVYIPEGEIFYKLLNFYMSIKLFNF